MLLNTLWSLYLLSVLIATTVFLQVTIQDQLSSIPNINQQLFQFIYISHWILVGVTGLGILAGLFGALFGGVGFIGASVNMKPRTDTISKSTNSKNAKRSDLYHFISQS